MQLTALFFILLAIGVFLIYTGLAGYMGRRRLEYIFPHYYSSGINYASIPLGITVLIWAFAFGLPLPNWIVGTMVYISFGTGFVGLLFNFVQPSFLKPQWYRWLMENHRDVVPLLREDVARMGYKRWKELTETQQGLAEWVAEVRRTHKLN